MAKKVIKTKKFSPKMLIIMAIVAVGLIVSVGLVKKVQDNRSQARYVEGTTIKVCTPLSISCHGNTSKICNKDGTAKTTLKICSSNQICKNLLGCVAKSSTTTKPTCTSKGGVYVPGVSVCTKQKRGKVISGTNCSGSKPVCCK